MSWDIKIIETGNGGDLVKKGNDLESVKGIHNMPYLGMFGGNVEQSTSVTQVVDAKDWWGNRLLMNANTSIQFNSITEKILNTTELTSGGRVVIENAIKNDLQFLSPQSKIKVTVTIVATDRINILIGISTELDGEIVITANFKRKADGDWVFEDFNDDFYFT